MANVIEDPLGAVLQALLGSFDPTTLAFAVLSGYAIFFLFFYGTDKWKTIDWAERFFFGFLMGLFSVLMGYFLFIPIGFIIVTTQHLEFMTLSIYSGPLFFLLLLTYFRVDLKVPLFSKEIHRGLVDKLTTTHTNFPILMVIFSVVAVGGILLNNPFFPQTNSALWLYYFIALNFLVFSYTITMSVFLLSLSSLASGEVDIPWFLLISINWYWSSALAAFTNFKDKMARKQKKETLNKSIKDYVIKISTSSFFRKIIIAILVFVLIFSVDREIQLFSPSIQLSDSRPSDPRAEIEIYRCWDGSFVFLQKMTTTYWIKLPIIHLINFNLTIQNPSNLSQQDIENINSIYLNHLEAKVIYNQSFVYNFESNRDGQIRSITLMPIENAIQGKSSSNFTLSYYNKLDLHLIEITEPNKSRLDNGSYLLTMDLSIKNTEPVIITSNRIPLIPLYFYNELGNITSFSFSWASGSQVITYSDYDEYASWIWSPNIWVNPNQDVLITINAVFEASDDE